MLLKFQPIGYEEGEGMFIEIGSYSFQHGSELCLVFLLFLLLYDYSFIVDSWLSLKLYCVHVYTVFYNVPKVINSIKSIILA